MPQMSPEKWMTLLTHLLTVMWLFGVYFHFWPEKVFKLGNILKSKMKSIKKKALKVFKKKW